MKRSIVVLAIVAATLGLARPADAAPVRWLDVGAGYHHTCGIRADHHLYCWGWDVYGQVGDGGDRQVDAITAPVEVAGGGTWSVLDVGSFHACAIRTGGRLFCWGEDTRGQLGNDVRHHERERPALVMGPGQRHWVDVAAGYATTCGIRDTGRLYCWGGDPATGGLTPQPSEVAGGGTTWTAVSVGTDHVCGLRAEGELACWGGNDSGQVGDGTTTTPRDQPVTVPPPVGTDGWSMVSAGRYRTCAVDLDGGLWCWGSRLFGGLGDGQNGPIQPNPQRVSGPTSGWTSVSVGDTVGCATRAGGGARCWGKDGSGQIGDGGTTDLEYTPRPVSGGRWAFVDAGFNHVCGSAVSAVLWCWGSDQHGKLGDGGRRLENHSTPSPVADPE